MYLVTLHYNVSDPMRSHQRLCFLKNLIKSKVKCSNEDINTYDYLCLYLNLEFPSLLKISFLFGEMSTKVHKKECFSPRMRVP